jgi:histidinol-phosphate/aromatic aminotransferase/cobyric acid decarboxylase-like protein/GNAT superfamily N-acetyltransferase
MDRAEIYRMRHAVYAAELHQHPVNAAGELRDALDAFNIYLAAREPATGAIAGFVSITPPGHGKYSIDKYLSRDELPFACDDGLYEVRLLTVAPAYRRGPLALQLMYAAFRYAESRGARRIVAIGRREVLSVYLKSSLRPVGKQVSCGAVTFELLTVTIDELRAAASENSDILRRMTDRIDWQLDFPVRSPAGCFHGGAFFDAIGDEFDDLGRRHDVINADVLDAWFDPSPKVTTAIAEALRWLLKTSPPADCRGMARAIARARGVPIDCILPAAGSSDLIFLGLRHWLTAASRVLILDPTYGEYAHVLERVIGCRVDRLNLSRPDGYLLHANSLAAAIEANRYDLVILVNPNSPTGRHMPRAELQSVLQETSPAARIWIDETYVEYAGPDQSLEAFAAESNNVIVCKSMSKVYALSGVRAAYLAGPRAAIADLRAITPPWAVSLPAQIAAVAALTDPAYYADQYRQTHLLREELARDLRALGEIEVIPGVANFLLCHIPESGPTAAAIVADCRKKGVFLRDAGSMSARLGRHSLRIAVKSPAENAAVIAAVRASLGPA